MVRLPIRHFVLSLCGILFYSSPSSTTAAIENPGVAVSSVPTASRFFMPLGDRSAPIATALRDELFEGFLTTVYVVSFTRISIQDGQCGSESGVESDGWYVHSPFNSNRLYNGQPYSSRGDFHPGEDWNGQAHGQDDLCQPVYPIAEGVVLAKGLDSGFGNMLFILHKTVGDELVVSVFAHLRDLPSVSIGQIVDANTIVGRIGCTGKSTGPHLHWEIRKSAFLINDGTTVALKDDSVFNPTTWPATLPGTTDGGQSFIAQNYLPPSGFVGGPRWARLTPVGTGPRSGGGSQSTAYDAATDTLIVFGGADPLSPCCVHSNDTWILKNATGSGGVPTWERLTPSAPAGLPPGRVAHSAVYDPATNRMIIFGGGQGDGFAFNPLFNDVWILTNANGLGGVPEWLKVTPSGGPPTRREGHGAFYKQATNEMFVFGGGNNGIMSVPNDLWVLRNANDPATAIWMLLLQTGDVPPRIEHFALAYDPASDRMTIAGGCCFYTNATRVLALNSATGIPQWTNLSPSGTLPPIGDALFFGYDRSSNRLIVQGISPGSGTNATWLLTGANAVGLTPMWVNTIPRGAPASPPEGAIRTGSGYNATTKKFILSLVTGFDAMGNPIPEVWVLSNADQVPNVP